MSANDPKTLPVSVLGLQINLHEWANLQIMKSGNNEDRLPYVAKQNDFEVCLCLR